MIAELLCRSAAAFFGPSARNAQQRQHAGGNCRSQLFEHRELAGVDQLGDFLGQVLADAFDLGRSRLGSASDVGERLGKSLSLRARVAIRAHAERIGVLKLQQVGDFVERGGNVAVGHAV